MNKFLKHAWTTAKQVIGNEHGWIPLVAGIIGAAATAYSASKSSAASSQGEDAEILPNTISGNSYTDQDFVFDQEASEAMKALTDSMNDWSQEDRNFFEQTFQPFQQSLIEGNKALIPDIVANSKEALSQNLSDLVASDHLKEQFGSTIKNTGGAINEFGASFLQQVRDIPTTEQRVGEAVAGIEQRFGEAGAELKRAMASKGLDVDAASKRALSIAKASAKAGAVGQAKEAARMEKLNATQAGVGLAQSVQESQANMLGAERAMTQSSATLTPQIGGVQETQSVSSAGEVGASLTQAQSEKILGQRKSDMNAEFTQEGVVQPKFFDRETGDIVDAAGNPIKKPKPARQPAYQQPKTVVGYWGGGPGVGGADSIGTGGFGGGGAGGDGGGPGIGGGNGPGGGAGSGVCCFVAGTKIAMPDGLVMNIEDITPGDTVMSRSFMNGEMIRSEVGGTIAVLRHVTYRMKLSQCVIPGITDDHPLWTTDGWCALDPEAARANPGYAHIGSIKQLAVGSMVYNINGELEEVLSINAVPGEVITYSLLDVTPARNFYANGYLASNKI